MNWSHRSDGDWSRPTVKRRDDGEWVTITSGPTGDFGWRDPPERSETIYTSEEGGLQAGLDALSPDTELVIDDGPYSGSFLHDQDETTVSGGADGATIELPSSGSDPIIEWPSDSFTDADVTAPISAGDETISVADTGPFSAGDDVRILDDTQVYRGLDRLKTSGDATTGEFQTVESVGDGELTLVDGADRDYPDSEAALEVSRVDWAMENVHYDNLTLSGYSTSDGDSDRPIEINEAFKELWLTDIDSNTWSYRGYDAHYGYYLYLDNVHVSDVGDNGITISVGTKNAIVRNCSATNCGHYGMNSGWHPTFNPAVNHRYVNCTVDEADDAGFDQHNGSEDVVFEDCEVVYSDDVGVKTRSLGTKIVRGNYTVDNRFIQTTQKAEDVTVKGVTVESNSRGILFWQKEAYDVENVSLEDCQFSVADRLIRYRAPDDSSNSYTVEVSVSNCAVDGEWVTNGHFEEEPPDADADWLNLDVTTSHPDEQTPAEYFG